MTDESDLILVAVEDPSVRDLICQQTLEAVGYRVIIATDIPQIVSSAARSSPSCIITCLEMQGLSAKDLMVMLRSQGSDLPVIVVASKGSEADIIQAFRLGAEDYLLWPLREPEILAVVERVLKRVHTRQQRERMEAQIRQANAELHQRVRELTTIYAIGKAVTSTTDLAQVSEKILDGAVQVTGANIGWFLLRDEATKAFYLVAHRNLPAIYADRLHKPWDDGISPLVARAGKMLSLYGDSLGRFPTLSKLGQSLLIVPIKSQNQMIGLLAMMRPEAQPFHSSAINLLEAVADFASISLVNARLFLAIEERLRAFQHEDKPQEREKLTTEMMRNFAKEQSSLLEVTGDTLERLAKIPASHWSSKQREALIRLRDQVDSLIHLAEATANIRTQNK